MTQTLRLMTDKEIESLAKLGGVIVKKGNLTYIKIENHE